MTTPSASTCGPSTLNGSKWRASASACSEASRFIARLSRTGARRTRRPLARNWRQGLPGLSRPPGRVPRAKARRQPGRAVRLVRPVARSVDRRRAAGMVDGTPADDAATTTSASPPTRTGHRAGRGAMVPDSHTAAPAIVRSTRSKSPTFWIVRRSEASVLRQHVEFDQRAGQRVVVRLHQPPAKPQIDRRRAAISAVQRHRAVERVEVLVDVHIAMGDAEPAEMPEATSRVFAPVGAVNDDHEVIG